MTINDRATIVGQYPTSGAGGGVKASDAGKYLRAIDRFSSDGCGWQYPYRGRRRGTGCPCAGYY